MTGILQTGQDILLASKRANRFAGVLSKLRGARMFLLVVVLPTLLVGLYLGAVASDQYESSADFVVRKAEAPKAGGDFGQLLGLSIGGLTVSPDAYVVQKYLLSHDSVARLRAEINLVGVFTRDGIDPVSRLWSDNPTPERLLKYFRNQVSINEDDITGITHLSVRTFNPKDSAAIARKLLAMGEQQVNAINQRTYNDSVSQAQRNFEEASQRLVEVENQFTEYRRVRENIDPTETSKAKITMIAGLTSNLTVARARLQAMAGTISRSSPQYQAMQRQVQTLEAQIAGHAASIAGSEQSVAGHLGEYERLVIRRQGIAQLYAAADIQLQQARADAKRQQLYLIRVVEPNVAVKSEYPERGTIVLTVFATLFFSYAIGWLLWAGVKEHSL